jgi:hypothetical protein
LVAPVRKILHAAMAAFIFESGPESACFTVIHQSVKDAR